MGSIQLDVLEKCLNLSMLRKTLASLPKTLDETYARILQNMNEEYAPYALQLLQWLVFSFRLLSLEEAGEIIAFDTESYPRFDVARRLPNLLDIERICPNLIILTSYSGDYYTNDDNRDIQLAHYSVKEYLISDRIQPGIAQRFKIQEMSAHALVTQNCLDYLLHIGSLTDVHSCDKSENIEGFPLATYVANYWFRHARIGESHSDEIIRSCTCFLLENTEILEKSSRLWSQVEGISDTQSFMLGNGIIHPPLHYASGMGLIMVTQALLNEGNNVNAETSDGNTALQIASAIGHVSVTQLLVENGAGINVYGGTYNTALLAAST